MTIDELSTSTGEWLRGAGPHADVVMSSRIRLARNLADQPFLSRADNTQRTEIYRRLVEATTSICDQDQTLLVDIDQADEIERDLLVERHLISRQHAQGKGSRGVVVTRQETQSLMINEEDHLRMQCLRSGLQLDALWKQCSQIDDQLAQLVPFAFDGQFGYLTACPTNVGTGIRVSVMLHLPALKMTKELERVGRATQDLHLAVRGLYGEGTEAIGDLYQISNQTTLGRSEDEYIRMFGDKAIPKIVEYERVARRSLAQHKPYHLDDKVWRAYGTLCNARRISSEETHALLSPIRMAIQMGRFKEINLATLNELFLMTQPAHLQKRHGGPMKPEEAAIARADLLRQKLCSQT